MSCANPYDWAKQSNEHRMHALNRYPLIYELMATSGDYSEFAGRIQGMDPMMRHRYNQEYQRWYKAFGRVWERIGCIQENTLGEHTKSFSFEEKPPTTRPYLSNAISGLRISGLGAMQASDFSPSDLPPLPTNYRWCMPPDLGGMAVSAERAVNGYPGWTYKVWTSKENKLYYLFHDQMTNADLWACPPTFTITAVRSEVKQIQSALLSKGYNPGTIDGIWGPKTCQAAYSFQRNELKEYGSSLISQFFFALGVSGLGTKYARSCDDWYTGDLGPDPDFVPAPTPLEVKRALLKLGYSVGPMTNIWDREVCQAAFKYKKVVLGEHDTVLGKTFFESLGFRGTLEVRDCAKYATVAEEPAAPAEEPVVEAQPEAKAGFGWIAVLLGLGAAGTVAYKKWKGK